MGDPKLLKLDTEMDKIRKVLSKQNFSAKMKKGQCSGKNVFDEIIDQN